ncbi:hypothetical protein EBA21_21110 [Xanthomonas oryzae pv. oryzae]|nr:hypothetical protein EBA21_21110 [Xanthomonas oryzae pv. oryzae]
MTWATPFGSEVAQVRSPGSLHNRWCCDPELKPPYEKIAEGHNGGSWRHINPDYATNIEKYYNDYTRTSKK